MEIIAEIGQNHNGDMELAKDLIFAASENGADVAKFQLFQAEETFGKVNNEWYDYNCKTQLSKDDIFYLADICKSANIEFLASAFHPRFVEWLEEVNVKRYKLASREIFDDNLISKYIETNKPLIVSLGFWEKESFPNILSSNSVDYLYCISHYPTELSELNFSKIDFNKYSGFSDHTIGISAAMIALSRGAKIIEKHFTIDKNAFGPDHLGSMDPKELKEISLFRNNLKLCLK